MPTPFKTADVARRIQDLTRLLGNKQTVVNRLEQERNDRLRYYGEQIARGNQEVARLRKQIQDLRRQSEGLGASSSEDSPVKFGALLKGNAAPPVTSTWSEKVKVPP